jgi:hypothetical protein
LTVFGAWFLILVVRHSSRTHMNIKHRLLAFVMIVALQWAALAQSPDGPRGPSFIESLIWSVLPIVLIAAFIWLIFMRSVRKMQLGYREEMRKHQKTLESLLERIAKALEDRRNTSRCVEPGDDTASVN